VRRKKKSHTDQMVRSDTTRWRYARTPLRFVKTRKWREREKGERKEGLEETGWQRRRVGMGRRNSSKIEVTEDQSLIYLLIFSFFSKEC
jgi:hypothetical protein